MFAFILAMAIQADVSHVDAAVATIVDSVSQSIPAKQKRKPTAVYPRRELNKGREAWVHVTYCIDEAGDIQNISILDSVGGTAFEKAAVNAVKRWEYEPALQGGQPVWQSRNEVYINFAIQKESLGASNNFIRRFKKIGKLIDQRKLNEADALFWDVYENYDLSLYELGKLWTQRVRYEALVGDPYRLNMALHRATASNGNWIDNASYANLLDLRVQVELALGKYSEAITSFDNLVAVKGNSAEEVLALEPTIDKLNEVINDDSIWNIKAEVRKRGECAYCDSSWNFTPVRNDFTFTNVQGSLHSVDMRCDSKRFKADASELVEWHIPGNWGRCHIQVYGEPGTTFDVVMLPADADWPD